METYIKNSHINTTAPAQPYVVGNVRRLDSLEQGLLMFELVHADERHLIAGYLFVSAPRAGYPNGVADYRNIDGSPIPSGQWTSKLPERQRLRELRKGFDLAVQAYLGGDKL